MTSWRDDLLTAMPVSPALLVWDIDRTIGNGLYANMDGFEVRPGIVEVIRELASRGYEQRFWSGGGDKHAASVAAAAGLDDIVQLCYRKPPYPMQPDAVRELLGCLPDLIIDDDASEAVSGCDFFLIPPFMFVED